MCIRWKEKMLSKEGKEILIKAVAQAIPIFAMGYFDITKEMCSQVSTMIAKYWWSNQDKEHSMHWISWLGFRDLHYFNMAKQGWRLLNNPDSLCAKILKAKYFSNTGVLEAKALACCSYTRRSIVQGIKMYWKG